MLNNIMYLAAIITLVSGCETAKVCSSPMVSPGYYPIDPLPVPLAKPERYQSGERG